MAGDGGDFPRDDDAGRRRRRRRWGVLRSFLVDHDLQVGRAGHASVHGLSREPLQPVD